MVVAQVVAYVFQDVAKVAASMWVMPSLRFRRRQIRWRTAGSLISFNTWAVVNQLAWFLHDSAPTILLYRFASPLAVNTLYVPSLADVQIRNFVQATTVPSIRTSAPWTAPLRTASRPGNGSRVKAKL